MEQTKRPLLGLSGIAKKCLLPSAISLSLLVSTQGFANHLPLFYNVHNLVSDGTITADHIDHDLVNPWGLAFGVTSPVWVANNGTGTSTIYNGRGIKSPLTVKIPGAGPAIKGTPTGMVFNNTNGFVVKNGGKSAPAVFLFATEDGTISGWAPSVDPTNAIIAVNNSMKKAIYKGLTRAANGKDGLLLAANFYSGQIDVFDSQFNPVNMPGAFVDPYLPQGYAPFNVQNINGAIYVCYAKQNADRDEEVKGRGLGAVDVFDVDGHLIQRVATGGHLNAPWGIALAPANFGIFSNHLLIGNFGDGRINVYTPVTHAFVGQLKNDNHRPITIDGLWALGFGNGYQMQPTNTLYFTAGPDDENHGLYGKIEVKS